MEGSNPLRPYYIPPSIESPSEILQNKSAATNISNKHALSSSSTTSFGSSARNILADMDYSDYLSESSPASGSSIKHLLEQAIWKYTSVFLAQPFEVAKTILQVHMPSTEQKGLAQTVYDGDIRRSRNYRTESSEVLSDDSDPDSPSYFTSANPLPPTPSRSSRARHRHGSPDFYSQSRIQAPQTPPKPLKAPHSLDLKSNSSLIGVLSALWTTEGSWGIWKGTNSTYVHSILLSTITSFARSFLSALLALPDPGLSLQLSSPLTNVGGLDILSSPSPLISLAVTVSAAGIAGIILAPLDIARTKLILTPSTHPPRSIASTLKSLSSWTLPFCIAPVTILHATLPTFISVSTPLFLRSKLGVDAVLTPNLYSVATFTSQTLELGLRLPMETILRRGQMHVAFTGKSKDLQPIVEVGSYNGLVGTIHSIVCEEGERELPAEGERVSNEEKDPRLSKPTQRRHRRKGQGFEGLWRGWRVGLWGLAGVWGAATLGGVSGTGGEF